VLVKRNSFIALCACLLFAQACKYTPERGIAVDITHEISPQPPRVGPVTITFRITHGSHGPITGVRIAIEANMSHAGMTPVFAEASEIGDGNYRATMNLSMAGDWVVVAHGTLPDGQKLNYQFEVNGVAPA
jgi:hypothetical protein